jgi:hypothetical protein
MPESQNSQNIYKAWLDKIVINNELPFYPESEISDSTIIGRGGYGVVRKAQLKSTGEFIAMKTLLPEACADSEELYESFTKEVCIGCCMSVHANINLISIFLNFIISLDDKSKKDGKPPKHYSVPRVRVR